MYSLLKNIGLKKFLIAEMPALATALAISETLYKFGSFILECFAFLITWYILSFFINMLLPKNKYWK